MTLSHFACLTWAMPSAVLETDGSTLFSGRMLHLCILGSHGAPRTSCTHSWLPRCAVHMRTSCTHSRLPRRAVHILHSFLAPTVLAPTVHGAHLRTNTHVPQSAPGCRDKVIPLAAHQQHPPCCAPRLQTESKGIPLPLLPSSYIAATTCPIFYPVFSPALHPLEHHVLHHT